MVCPANPRQLRELGRRNPAPLADFMELRPRLHQRSLSCGSTEFAFARRQEQIRFQPMLPRVQIPVPAAQRVQLLVRPALHDAARLPPPESDPPAEWSTAGARSRTSSAPASSTSAPPESSPPIPNPGSTSPRPESKFADPPESPAQSKPAAAGRPKASRRARRRSCRTSSRSSPRTHPRAQSGTPPESRSSVASGRENAMFSRIVPSNRNVSCSTTPSCVR